MPQIASLRAKLASAETDAAAAQEREDKCGALFSLLVFSSTAIDSFVNSVKA
jgi:hypothetical protein